MDKAVFCCAGQHLHHLACCGQALLRSAPPRTGIKARVPPRLWERVPCYAGFIPRVVPGRRAPFQEIVLRERAGCLPGGRVSPGHPPTAANLRALQGAERGLAAHRQGPRDLQRDQAGFWRGPPAPCCLERAGDVFSRYLYLNSSSSRARSFLWISGFSCGVTVVCSVSKSVGRGLLPVRAA